jgi:S1-C subfamily serine protease
MKRKLCAFAFVLVGSLLLASPGTADNPLSSVLKRDGYTVSLDLTFSRKHPNSMQRLGSILDWGTNGYATGFVVGDGLVMTAYHVVSGNLTTSKKAQLGFGAKDELEVKVYISGCRATVVKVDAAADLALLRASCRSQKQPKAPAFQIGPSKDERLLLIARPNNQKAVRWGTFEGAYELRGQQYWSAKLDGRDGYSGSPVFNEKAELVGVFSGYDWSKDLAVISPGAKAKEILEAYHADPEP